MKTLLILLMSVQLINDCVALPHPPTWQQGVRVRRHWQTTIARGVTGGESRASGRAPAPYVRMEWDTRAHSIPESARLRARLREALKRGRACAPFFARPQFLSAPAPLSWEWHPSLGNAVLVHGLVIGHRYHYAKGQWDTKLSVTTENELTESGDFIADASGAIIYLSSAIAPGTVTDAGASGYQTTGLWPWASGQYAFFLRADADRSGYENRSLLINCGTLADGPYLSGGAVANTASAINRDLIVGYTAPAEAIYQTARTLASNDPAAVIVCEVNGLLPSIECNVRVHFAEIEAGMDGTTGRRVFDVLANGAPLSVDVEPYYLAGRAANKAASLDLVAAPDGSGKLTITLRPKRWIEVFAASFMAPVNPATPLYALDSVMVPVGALVLLKDQPDPKDNGLYRVGVDHMIARATLANTGRKLEVLTAIHVADGVGNGGKVFRCSNVGAITLGTDAITFEEITGTPNSHFRAGVNAIEVRQYTWEVVELIEGTGPNLLKWDGFLNGYYPVNQPVYPVIFGRPFSGNLQAVEPSMAAVTLAIKEPLGTGELAVDTCPVEECLTDDPIPIPVVRPGPSYPSVPLEGASDFQPYFEFDGVSHPAGIGSDEPQNGLWYGVFDTWVEQVWEVWDAYKAFNNIDPDQEQLVWAFNDQDNQLRWNANFVFGETPPNTAGTATGYYWEIWVQYKVSTP